MSMRDSSTDCGVEMYALLLFAVQGVIHSLPYAPIPIESNKGKLKVKRYPNSLRSNDNICSNNFMLKSGAGPVQYRVSDRLTFA